jgi:outer membrane protein assembly factor BamE (lipoprotein component of BamABCDE complex)
MKQFFLATLLVLAVSVTGCASTGGRPFDTGAVQTFVDGRTTQAEVRQTLGDPQTAQDNGDGTTLWLYSSSSSTADFRAYVPFAGGGQHTKGQSLQLTFDKAGRLVSHTMTESNQ